MTLADTVLTVNNDLPIRTDLPIHSGKVRSVYWLNEADSRRLISANDYEISEDTPLALMVISDRISAFDCVWHAEGGLNGVPGKGAALNAISNHWFEVFKQNGLADSHILDIPHPFVWLVKKAKPVMIEAIGRQYITGSMWRAYNKGERNFCGIQLPDSLQKNQKLPELLITPSTKGILKGIPGVPEEDDTNISRSDIENNAAAFNFRSNEDIALYEKLLRDGFDLITRELDKIDQIFVDTKFEFGYVKDASGEPQLIYMDEVGTPDSSRIWDGASFRDGKVIEKSKEEFRQLLLEHFPDSDILLNSARMEERKKLAADNALPVEVMQKISATYRGIAEKITGQEIITGHNPRAEIIDTLNEKFGLIR